MSDRQRRNDSISKPRTPEVPASEALRRLVGSVLGGPTGVLDVGGLEPSWPIEALAGPYPGEQDVRLGVVSPGVKKARAVAQTTAAEVLSGRKPSLQNAMINSRDNLYHTTSIDNLEKILDQGIKPRERLVPNKTDANGKTLSYYPQGVSLSRVPKIPTKSAQAIIVLDRKKVPPNNPIAEAAWMKTEMKQLPPEEKRFQKERIYSGADFAKLPNPTFEFENRTKNKIVPPDAIKKILLQYDPRDPSRFKDYYESTAERLRQKGVPVSVVPETHNNVLDRLLLDAPRRRDATLKVSPDVSDTVQPSGRSVSSNRPTLQDTLDVLGGQSKRRP